MSKANVRWIDFGTGADQVSAQAMPASFSPSSYTPEEVASEGTDKVSAHLKGIDLQLANLGATFTDEFFTSNGVATEFQLVSSITSSTLIDVYWNGILQEETADWTRDDVNERIQISPALPSDTRLRVRIHNADPFSDQLYSGDNSTTVFTVAVGFGVDDRIDVHLNGQMLEEGGSRDFTRDAGLDQITMAVAPANNSRLRIRVYS